jgi:CheY-like chemotaxis protein
MAGGTVLIVEDEQSAREAFIEQMSDGRFAVRAEGSEHSSDIFETEADAIAHLRMMNPDDYPDMRKIRNVDTGSRD